MYLRFVVSDNRNDSGSELGVFQAGGALWEDGELHPREREEYELTCKWFNTHLRKPTRFAGSKRSFGGKKREAVSWFKDTALEHLAHVRRLVAILQSHGLAVHVLNTDQVGYVVYEDEYQVVAEPCADQALASSIGKALANANPLRRRFLKALLGGAAGMAVSPIMISAAVGGPRRVGGTSSGQSKGKHRGENKGKGDRKDKDKDKGGKGTHSGTQTPTIFKNTHKPPTT